MTVPALPDEGYVKYRCLHTPGPAPRHPDLAALNALRTRLFDAGLVGALSSGVGFGNLSVRADGDAFVVTASGTGGARELGPEGWCLVASVDVEANSVVSCGPRQASSEAMSHGAAYRADSSVRCVVHIHSRGLFDRLLAARVPATSRDAAFGTPAMAKSLAELVREHPGRGVAVMTGHDEGILSYGPDIPSVAALLDALAQWETDPSLPFSLQSVFPDNLIQYGGHSHGA